MDEDGRAELDGDGGRIVRVDGGRAPADVGRPLEDGDVGRDAGPRRELGQMVGGGRATGAGAYGQVWCQPSTPSFDAQFDGNGGSLTGGARLLRAYL